MKDPAFLFYSKDFYEGTRTMLPEERACYVDLMIYQHQNGIIPNDIDRISMYCSGCSKATIKAVLKAKFIEVENGYVNIKLEEIVKERKEYSSKQHVNGRVGQFWKKSKQFLSKEDFKKLHELLETHTNDDIYEIVRDKDINEATLKATLQDMLKHLEDADANEDINSKYLSKDKRIYLTAKLFYETEIENNSYAELINDYSQTVKYLLDNPLLNKPVYHVLKIECQLTYMQFKTLCELYTFEKFKEKLKAWVNNSSYSTGKKTIYQTIDEWCKRK